MAQRDLKKMTEEFLKFRDVEIQKKKFHFYKKMINIDEVDIEKTLISDEFAYGKTKDTNAKHLVGYKNGKTKIRPLYMKLPQIAGFLIWKNLIHKLFNQRRKISRKI